jgi:putative transposase
MLDETTKLGGKHVENEDRQVEGALKRYAAIAPVSKKNMSLAEASDGWSEVREMRARELSSGAPEVSMRTLRRWAAAYRNEGFDGLHRKERNDQGCARKLDARVLERAAALKAELPVRSVRQIIDIMAAEGTIEPGSVSRSTLARHLKASGYMDIPRRPSKGVNRFVKAKPNQLWQGDLKYGPYVPDGSGKARRTYLIAFIDDCSRLITHAEFYFDQDGHSLEHCLRRAILKRGIPEAVFVDNGKIFVSRVLRTACATLGVRHLTAAPYAPQGKGKIERWIGAADRSFIQELKVSPALSLEELNRRFWGWLEEFYHRRPHSSLEGKTPLDAWQAGIRDVRTVTPAEITAAFLHSAERKVDHTGCFSYNGRLYASGVEYAGKRVLLRFDPADLGSMAVFYKGEHVAEAKLATTSVQSHSQSPEPDLKVGKVGFDELMVRQKERRLKRRLGAISFSTLEDE